MQASTGRNFPLLFLALLLFLAGGLLTTLAGTQAYLARILLLAGAAVLALTLLRMGTMLRFVFLRFRSVAEPGPTLNWILTGAILLVAAGVLGQQVVRFDMTKRRSNELSATSREALATVSRDVELIGAFRDNAPLRDTVREMFAVYRAQSRKLQTRLFDPDREPDLARQYGIDRANVILVRTGDAREIVDEIEEPAVTQAILRVEDPRRPSVCFVLGHGEVAPDRQPLNRIRHIMKEGGLQIESVRLGEVVDVPESATVLVIAGPRTRLTPGEVQAVDRFLTRGGRLLLAVEPNLPTGLEPLLERWGIVVDGRRVRDDSPLTQSLGLGSETIAVAQVGEHPITRGLTSVVVLAGATGVRLADRAVAGTSGTDLLKSGPRAVFLEPADAAGQPAGSPPRVGAPDSTWLGAPGYTAPPARQENLVPATEPATCSLAAVLEWDVPSGGGKPTPEGVPEKPHARLVVLGDSDVLRDGTIDLYGNNAFVGRLFGWLSERDFLLRFPPPDRAGTPLKVELAGLRTTFLIVQIVLPLILYLSGFILWVRRR
ncbi:MAG: GldG family protein [Candidatus Eisenbacteria bacterium]|uniref:GldG family protein n=1 Tax=Eiseniibacteriota bacterium TaxID=2212470 RepID=A0A956RQV8_UNCEI|nr:GldG family protein [Candidatus Eisenbacteria bacterium]